jgi:hypothetical protein
MTSTERKQTPENTTAKKPVIATRRVRLTKTPANMTRSQRKESKQAPANMTAKTPVTPANATRRVRLMAIVPNGGRNMNPRITTPRQMASKEIG